MFKWDETLDNMLYAVTQSILAIGTVAACLLMFASGTPGAEIFALPLTTLILGWYFGSRNGVRSGERNGVDKVTRIMEQTKNGGRDQ